MRKIKAEILENLIRAGVTGCEIDLLIWLSHYQNEAGVVKGVFYATVCRELGIAPQTFYNAKDGLEHKGIICTERTETDDYDIRIVGNDFSGEEVKRGEHLENYINTGLPIFYHENFFGLTPKEKLLAMELLKISRAGGRSYRIGTSRFFQKYMERLAIKKRTLQYYMTKLRQFFSIGIKDGSYWITPKKNVENFPDTISPWECPTDRTERAKQIARSICRRFRLEGLNEADKGIRELIEQYTYRVKTDLEEYVTESVRELLSRNNRSAKKKDWKKRSVNIKYLHKLLRQKLEEGKVVIC